MTIAICVLCLALDIMTCAVQSHKWHYHQHYKEKASASESCQINKRQQDASAL